MLTTSEWQGLNREVRSGGSRTQNCELMGDAKLDTHPSVFNATMMAVLLATVLLATVRTRMQGVVETLGYPIKVCSGCIGRRDR